MVELWRLWRGSDMSPGILPFAGGAAEQPMCVIASFTIMEATYRNLPKGNT
jgi:hypothetical protein